MEALTRLVSESLARYGLDRPVDYRRLQWSRWYRCESLHSLLFVPSKPGVFALAEEVMEFGTAFVGADALGSPAESQGESVQSQSPEMQSLQGRNSLAPHVSAGSERGLERVPEGRHLSDDARRMLAVLQFAEDDDMAFVLDRMLSRQNPMRARLLSGRCFVRYVVIEDESQRRSICSALNQWLVSSGEKASGIGAHFASSLELAGVGRIPDAQSTDRVVAGASPASAADIESLQSELDLGAEPEAARPAPMPPHLDSGAAPNIRCIQPFPSGF